MHRSSKVAFAAALCSLAVPGAASAATKSVFAGPPIKKAPAGVPKDGDINSFFPKAVTIHTGDSVSWKIAGFHLINIPKKGSAPSPLAVPDATKPATGVNDAAGAPFWFNGQGTPVLPSVIALGTRSGEAYTGATEFGSGLPLSAKPKPYVVTFPKAGTYTYFCQLHPGMKGKVTVVAKSKSVPSAKSDAARVKTQLDSALTTLKKLDKQKTKAANTVVAGPDSTSGPILFRFSPGTLKTKVNTPVTLTMTPGTTEDHTFTFAKNVKAAGKTAEKELLAPLGAGNPPTFAFSPKWAYPSEAPGTAVSYDGTNHGDGFLNSGVLDGSSATPFPQKFTVSFSKAGTYSYFCAIHPFMVGKITATS
ncbi:Plastocyanin [Baekduia alba]|uniref:plastocyanin/azurin family copper-binding protein n=1 Tax=Baekduia alba TaxID=2997333 RepID=UPI002340C2C4|nr:plastocyanin/azurin family copper-binding protein [Baekduia alba]WCB96621.1 Plastocyanin [Baekduia alba]